MNAQKKEGHLRLLLLMLLLLMVTPLQGRGPLDETYAKQAKVPFQKNELQAKYHHTAYSGRRR